MLTISTHEPPCVQLSEVPKLVKFAELLPEPQVMHVAKLTESNLT
jgi:hypothetical protein